MMAIYNTCVSVHIQHELLTLALEELNIQERCADLQSLDLSENPKLFETEEDCDAVGNAIVANLRTLKVALVTGTSWM
jgi:hypothetical protein